jgi:hypothetical protein
MKEVTEDKELMRFARAGAELEFVDLLKKQARLKKLFPGVEKTAIKLELQKRAAHARSCKRVKN